MMNKKIIASLLGLAAFATATATYAYQGNPGTQNPDCTDSDRNAAVQAMFEGRDYAAFQDLFAEKGVGNKITTEAQFNTFVDLRNAQLAGDTDKVEELQAELGLGQRRQDGSGNRMGKGNGSGQGKGNGRGYRNSSSTN